MSGTPLSDTDAKRLVGRGLRAERLGDQAGMAAVKKEIAGLSPEDRATVRRVVRERLGDETRD